MATGNVEIITGREWPLDKLIRLVEHITIQNAFQRLASPNSRAYLKGVRKEDKSNAKMEQRHYEISQRLRK